MKIKIEDAIFQVKFNEILLADFNDFQQHTFHFGLGFFRCAVRFVGKN